MSSKKISQQKMANDLYQLVKKYGILDYENCMTRLRLKLKQKDVLDIELLKKVPGVINVIHPKGSDEYQIILGPGTVAKVYDEFKKIADSTPTNSTTPSLKEVANQVKFENQQKRSNLITTALSKFAKIFAPLIPAFIGAGLFAGIAGIMQSSVQNNWQGHETLQKWYSVFNIVNTVWLQVFLVIFGWRFAEAFGGKGYIGAIIGALFMSNAFTNQLWTALGTTTTVTVDFKEGANPVTVTIFGGAFLGINIDVNHLWYNWFTSGLTTVSSYADYHYLDGTLVGHSLDSLGSPHGSMFGVILGITGAIYFEKFVSKWMPDVVSPIFTPFLVIVTFMVFNFLLIIPLSGYLFLAVSTAFQFLTQGIFAPFGDALLAGIFLICVVFGIHQGFLPVYFALMVKYNINTLFPVLALAGASQVGCAIAMFFIANKGGTFRKQIASAIVPGFLGIGEPLIYGVSLPRIVPFVTACIGAMLPGFFVGALNQWGHINMGLLMPTGPSGLLALPMITSSAGVWQGYVVYISGLVLGYISGCGFTFLGYKIFKNNAKINWNLA